MVVLNCERHYSDCSTLFAATLIAGVLVSDASPAPEQQSGRQVLLHPDGGASL